MRVGVREGRSRISTLTLRGPSGASTATCIGNHVRLCAKDPANGRLAILREGADDHAGIDDLEGVQRRGQRGHHIGGGHRQRHRARAKNRMSAGQQLLGVDLGDGAGGGDFQIAANELHADSGSGLERAGARPRPRTPIGPPMRLAPFRPAAAGGHGFQRGSRSLLLPEANRVRQKSAHHQRSVQGLKCRRRCSSMGSAASGRWLHCHAARVGCWSGWCG